MSFCVAVTRSTSVYDSSATFFELLGSVITVASKGRGSLKTAQVERTTNRPSILVKWNEDGRYEAHGSSISSSVPLPSTGQVLLLPVVFPLFPVCIVLCDSTRRNCRYINRLDVFLYIAGRAPTAVLLLPSFFDKALNVPREYCLLDGWWFLENCVTGL